MLLGACKAAGTESPSTKQLVRSKTFTASFTFGMVTSLRCFLVEKSAWPTPGTAVSGKSPK